MHRTLMLFAVVGLLAATLGACDTIDEDTTAGRTKAEAVFFEPQVVTSDQGDARCIGIPKRITWADGKDKGRVMAKLDLEEGSFSYEGSGIEAAEVARVEGQLRAELGDDVVNGIESAVPNGLPGLIDALGRVGLF